MTLQLERLRNCTRHACWIALAIFSTILTGCTSNSGVDAALADASTHDGLIPLQNTRAQRAWIRPGFDLSGYTKVMLVGAGIQYRPVAATAGTTAARSDQTAFAMTEKSKRDLEELITEEFDKALQRLTRFEVVEAPGPDVLLVRGAFLDVVSRVPTEGPGRTDYYLDSVGQATFMVELIDSQSEAVLLRAVDTRAAETPGYTYRSTRVTNAAQARRVFARWATMLVDALNELTSDSLSTDTTG